MLLNFRCPQPNIPVEMMSPAKVLALRLRSLFSSTLAVRVISTPAFGVWQVPHSGSSATLQEACSKDLARIQQGSESGQVTECCTSGKNDSPLPPYMTVAFRRASRWSPEGSPKEARRDVLSLPIYQFPYAVGEGSPIKEIRQMEVQSVLIRKSAVWG